VSDRNTIVDRLLRNARTQAEKPAIHFRREGAPNGFAHLTWADYAGRCRAFAGALLSQGYAPGDAVTIMGENSPEWLIADVGAMLARGVAAGIYQTSTAEQAQYIVDHCEAKVWVVEDAALWRKMRAARDALPRLTRVVLVRGAEEHGSDPLVVSFEDFLAAGAAHQAQVDTRLAEIQDADLATLIYTSGTTGPPKGVMLSHRNLGFTADLALQIIGQASPEDCVVSYLPLSHIAEQMFSIHVSIAAGYPIWVAGGLDRLKDTLVVARPTVFMGVPRVWEKFQAALEGRLREAKGLKGRHRGLGPRRGPAPDAADRRDRAARGPGRPEVRPGAQAFLRQTRRSARARPPARGRQRRRAHRPQHARVLRQRGHHHPRGLRPVRGLGAHDLQPAVPRAATHRHRGPAPARRAGQDRAGRRDPGARRQCVPGATTSSPRPPPRR
jgi:non-ribosomal peptide synthetase component F